MSSILDNSHFVLIHMFCRLPSHLCLACFLAFIVLSQRLTVRISGPAESAETYSKNSVRRAEDLLLPILGDQGMTFTDQEKLINFAEECQTYIHDERNERTRSCKHQGRRRKKVFPR